MHRKQEQDLAEAARCALGSCDACATLPDRPSSQLWQELRIEFRASLNGLYIDPYKGLGTYPDLGIHVLLVGVAFVPTCGFSRALGGWSSWSFRIHSLCMADQRLGVSLRYVRRRRLDRSTSMRSSPL